MINKQNEIYEKIQKLLRDNFNVTITSVDVKLENELSSIDRITFILLVEDEFKISYNFEKNLTTVQEVIDFIMYRKNCYE